MTNKEFKGFVRLSSDQYAELKLTGSLVIEGRTIEYSPLDTIYMITDAGNMIDVSNTTEGEPNDVVLNITNNILRAQLNQSIKTTINNKQDKLTFDTAPTANSNNPVKSGGIYDALASKQDNLTTTNVDSGTISQNIGFDTQGNLVRANAGGGGKQLYQHVIHGTSLQGTDKIYLTIISDSSSGYSTRSLLNDYLKSINATALGSGYQCIGWHAEGIIIPEVYSLDTTRIGITYLTLSNGATSGTVVNSGTITDTVTPL